LVDVERALAMWQQLAPAGELHRIELLDTLASIRASLGDTQAARVPAVRVRTRS
jgi:hypothetical protein